MTDWAVYLCRCADDSLYTGVTTDIARRMHEHNHSTRGARYTRVRRPVQLVYVEVVADRSAAQRREYQIRTLSRKAKLRLVHQGSPC